ncbi:MAG TPA: hypothetical protein DCO89_03060, partial [Clostridiales bacterium]|nr:hypothetical protein [Clostridiales bacterium]
MKFKKVLMLIFFALVSVSGVLFGCQGKYDNMKITSDRDETGLQLYLGEDSTIEGGPLLSVGTITFTISGVGDDVSKKLLYNYDHDIVKILDVESNEHQTTVKLQAISGGSTQFTAISEEGGKKDTVNIECIRKITSLSFNSEFKPAIFNEENSSITFSSQYLVYNQDTTQTEVKYYLVSGYESATPISIDGVSLTEGGVLTLSKTVAEDVLHIMVQSSADMQLHSWVDVHLISPIKTDDIEILPSSDCYKDGRILLTLNGENNEIEFTVLVHNTTEDISFNYKLVEVNNTSSSNVNCVYVSNALNYFKLSALDIGKCWLILEIEFDQYTDLNNSLSVSKTLNVEVIQLPSTIAVNGIDTDFNDVIFTYYKNNLGKQYFVNVGEELAYEKQFLLVAEDKTNFTISRRDGSLIDVAELKDGAISGQYSLLSSGDSFYIKGNLKNQTARIYVYAYGTLEYNNPLKRTLTLTTYLGSQNVTATDFTTLNGEVENTYFVEVGKTFTLNYEIDSSSSARGIKLLGLEESPLSEYVSVSVGEGNYPTINVTALKQGKLSCKLVLDNLVESDVFTIWCFVAIDYNNKGGYALSVDSPLTNRNIAEANYDINKCLESFVMSLGTGVQMYLSTNPGDATIYGIKYEPVIIVDGVEEIDGSDYFTVNKKSGFVIAKKFMQQEEGRKSYVKVTVSSLRTDENGVVELVYDYDAIKYVNVEVYIPLNNVSTSKSEMTLYWKDKLNPMQIANGVYSDVVSLRLDPISINKDKLRIKWDAGADIVRSEDNSNLSCTLYAYNAPEEAGYKSVYTLTVTVNYYSTTIVKRVALNVIKPVWADKISAYVEDDYDNSTAYFDVHEYGEDFSNVSPIKIHTKAFSASGEENVTFNKMYYKVDPAYRNYARVDDKDGTITPLIAGSFDIMVFAEDMISASSTSFDLIPTQYKVIHVVIADGKSEFTALRIRTEEEFSKLLQVNENYSQSIAVSDDSDEGKEPLYYYMANNITLKNNKSYFATKFYDNLDGRNQHLENLSINENGALFGEIKENSSISNLNVYVSLTEELNLADKDYKFAGLTLNNSGMLKNVYVNFVNANLTVTSSSVQSLSVAGLTLNNNGTIDFCHVVMNLNVASLNDCRISTLSIGGLVGNNNNYISGLNNNYDYYSGTTQEYEFDGSIFVSVKISAEQSNIGAVAGVNNNNGIIGAYDNGVAVDARIMAKNINNVGGIAGKNLSTIKNVLAKVDIIANNNIGGVAGLSCNESKSVAEINNAVVELYQDVIDLEKFATIIGNENVGGVVGLLNGNLVSKFNTDTEEDENEINHTILSNSYIKSYADKCFISGNENVGGLIGNAIFANIQSCYANVDLKKFDAGNLQIADMTNVGGIAGLIEASNVSKAYYIGSAEGELIGSLFGNVSHNDYQQTTVSQFYSPVNAEFVASGAEADYSIINSHNFVEDLTDASIYENWAITNTENELYANDWFIDSSKNSGYPQLIFGNIIMHKLMPNDLFISPKLDVKKVNDALLVYTNENIYIDDILKITTDVDVRATIYVFSDVNNVLLPNSTNKLSAKTYLRSTTNQVITLTFVLGNNPNIRRSIQVAFIDKVLALKTNSIRIKKGASDTIIAEFAKQLNKQNENVFELVAQNYYKLGINFNEEYFGEENAKLKIFDANIETIGEQKVILFNNNSILKGLESVAKDFVIKLYHQITYTNLAEEVKNEYIEVANSNLNVEVYAGASNIGITNSKIDMTLIEDVTFDVILKTDRSDDQIVLTLKSPFVYAEGIASSDIVDENEEKPRVKLSDNCETATDRNSAKLILSVLNISPSILSDGELIATFNLKFNEKYLNTQQTESIFNQVFNFEISFSDIEAKLSTKVDVTAKPQRLLKIDVAHYPVGVVDGVEYTLTSTLSNNLTPGQEGLLVIDIYPEYAQFDQILIKSGTDNKGNRISFIQVAKYDISGTSESKFLELRPSAVITDDGIILQRISNITSLHSEFSNEEYTFDGKFYVKTLMGTNVDFDQLINLEVIGKSTIKDETGNITESYEISKPIDIMVNQAPLVKLEYKDQLYKKFVQHQTEDIQNNNGIRTDLYNLTTAGTTLQFDISYYKLSLSHLNLKINAIDLSTGKELKHVEDGEEVIEKHWHHNIEGDKLYLTIEDTCPSGVLLKFSVTGEEFVSDYKETYESNSFEFVVVDYIITGIDVNEGNYTFIVGDITPVAVSLATVKGTQSKQKEYASIKDLENEINYHTKYWYNGAQDNAPAWSFTRHTDLSDSAEFDIYDVYGTPYPDKDNLFGYKLNVYAKKQTGDGTFKVEVPYFYDFTAYATTFGGINLNCDEAIQYNEDLKRIVKMDLKTVTNIDDPIPVYTIEEFYKMQENADI